MTRRQNDSLLWSVAVVLAVLGVALMFSGCAMRGAVAVTPTAAEQDVARHAGLKAVAYVEAVGAVAGEVGAQLAVLPVPVAVKTGYDCTLLRIAGTATVPSAAVTTACGPVPLRAVAPLTVGMETLRSVSTCASLRATVSGLQAWIAQLVTMLEQAESPALKMAGASMRVTLGLLVTGGVACSH